MVCIEKVSPDETGSTKFVGDQEGKLQIMPTENWWKRQLLVKCMQKVPIKVSFYGVIEDFTEAFFQSRHDPYYGFTAQYNGMVI